jgi:serine/threonine protein kinase
VTAPIRSHLLGGRYQLDRVVGAGGFGTVFEARDTLLDAKVAIKLLSRLDPREITDFKREFRAATALLHPNVVVLHELGWDASGWFISMDLVDGMDLGRWLALETSSQLSATRTALEEPAHEHAGATAPPAPYATAGRPSPRRSADVFAQIAGALAFLHQRAVVHGDLKPSNVVIGAGDRPVLVDFGLAQSLTRTAQRPNGFRGTPAYAAPEAGTARALASSSDLYSLGVMMFEAWAGRLPFEGSPASIMRSKREVRAPVLRELNEEVPSAVAALVDALLDPAAERRPDALVVMDRLRDWISTGNDQAVRGMSSAPAPPPTRHGVLGRDEELGAILGALRASTRPVIFLAGESGIGKTRLASACAEAWGASSGACVLTASCFERERGPFELLDGLGAAMLAAPGAQAVLDSHVAQVEALASLAPSLAATTRATLRGGLATADEREHAIEAAAQLLAAIAERAPVLLLIDDLQWADADSLWALERILTSPRLERVALLTTVRPGAATAEALAASLASTTEVRQVVLGPLADRDIDELTRSRFCGAHHASDLLAQIRRGCSGNPLLAVELADQVARGGEVGDASLDRLVGARLGALGTTARDLFELASAAGHPVDERDLVLVGRGEANATTDDLVRGLSVLRQAALLDSVSTPRAGTLVRPRHARLAAAALDPLDKSARAALHARWAAALEKSANASNAEVIARHWLASGAPERAASFLLVAAQTALASYAFAKARELVSIGLTASRSNREKTALLVVLAETHAAEGSGEAAARRSRSRRATCPPPRRSTSSDVRPRSSSRRDASRPGSPRSTRSSSEWGCAAPARARARSWISSQCVRACGGTSEASRRRAPSTIRPPVVRTRRAPSPRGSASWIRSWLRASPPATTSKRLTRAIPCASCAGYRARRLGRPDRGRPRPDAWRRFCSTPTCSPRRSVPPRPA